MTIKEFALLCNCNPQTLRYYDRMDLLKPVKVDPYSGYRYYNEEQAIQYVKIKNLQLAGFSIDEIKDLLDADSDTVNEAFSKKIRQEEEKLQKIREIQQSYQNEIERMKEKVQVLREAVLKSMMEYDPTEEFGINEEEYKAIEDPSSVIWIIMSFLKAISNMICLPMKEIRSTQRNTSIF